MLLNEALKLLGKIQSPRREGLDKDERLRLLDQKRRSLSSLIAEREQRQRVFRQQGRGSSSSCGGSARDQKQNTNSSEIEIPSTASQDRLPAHLFPVAKTVSVDSSASSSAQPKNGAAVNLDLNSAVEFGLGLVQQQRQHQPRRQHQDLAQLRGLELSSVSGINNLVPLHVAR